MSLFSRIFKKDQSLKECPRCLGKGHVDYNDIKRLHQELRWLPGTCAYCDGTGKVKLSIEDITPVDTSFLVINLPKDERKRIINGHPDAIERGKQHEEQVEIFVHQISYLHFETGLSPVQIAKFFLIGEKEENTSPNDEKELIEYIETVIKIKADNK